MPFDGLEIAGQGAARLAPRPGLRARLADRWQALKLWVQLGTRSSGIEALDPDVAVDRPDPGVVQLLVSAAALIEPEGKWIQGAYRTFGGRYCAIGALQAAGLAHGHATRIRARRLLTTVARGRGFATVERMNDASTHAGVCGAFDTAIAAAISERMVPYGRTR